MVRDLRAQTAQASLPPFLVEENKIAVADGLKVYCEWYMTVMGSAWHDAVTPGANIGASLCVIWHARSSDGDSGMRRCSCMATICIANYMDIAVRMLPRLGSYLRHSRLVYQLYTCGKVHIFLDKTFHMTVVKIQEPALSLCARVVHGV